MGKIAMIAGGLRVSRITNPKSSAVKMNWVQVAHTDILAVDGSAFPIRQYARFKSTRTQTG
jgi:hypothetical protein